MGYRNTQIDQLLAQGALSSDPAVRRTYYEQVQQILVHDKPEIPLVQAQYFFGANQEYKGFNWEKEGTGYSFTWFGWAAVWWTKGQPIPTSTQTTSALQSSLTQTTSAAQTPSTGDLLSIAAIAVVIVVAGAVYLRRRRPKP
jgi:hypothetical protein